MAKARRNAPRAHDMRRTIAVEAARVIAEGGLRDYGQAKRKAAASLGVFDDASLPRNSEVEDALREHQRLFQAGDHGSTLRRLRTIACEAMQFFSAHEPRLVGAVLDGTADDHSAVCLHLYSDCPDSVLAQLHDQRIPYQTRTRRMRLDRSTTRDVPAIVFSAGDTAVDLTLLPYDRLRQAPVDRISEKPMQRASLAMLQALLRADADEVAC